MSIKFACACGRRMSAPDGSSGRWVRCPECQEKMQVPGEPEELLVSAGSGGAAALGSKVSRALAWDEERAERRARAQESWLPPEVEQWVRESGVWVPSGLAAMAAAALVGLVSYALGGLTMLPICALAFLVGLGCFLYGRYAED